MYITDKEYKQLKSFGNHCKFKTKFTDIQPLFSGDKIIDFVINYIKSRTNKEPIIEEVGVYAFNNVNMHIDYINNLDYRILMLPIKGRGELAHFVNNKIEYSSFDVDNRKLIILNDHEPHSFVSKTINCFAILASVHINSIPE